jgi:hypothetical protein
MRDAAGTGPRVGTVIGPWRKSEGQDGEERLARFRFVFGLFEIVATRPRLHRRQLHLQRHQENQTTEQNGQPLQLCRHPAFQSLLDELRRLEQIRIHAGFGHGAGNRLKSVRDGIGEVCHAGKTGMGAYAGD